MASLKTDHRKLEALIDLAEILSEQNNFQESLRIIAQKAISIFHAETAFILLLNPKTQETVKTVYKEGRELKQDRYRLVSTNVYGWVLDNEQSFLSRDIKKDRRFLKNQFQYIPVKSVMASLLKVEGFIIGCLLLINRADGSIFAEDDLELLKKMSSLVSPYLHNIQNLKDYFEPPLPKSSLLLKYTGLGLLGKSSEFIDLLQSIEAAARRDVGILLEGETGTGKSLIAKAIHRASERREKPFIVVDCGAIPEHLLESELFGHKKGAFTGATQDRKGLIEAADGGTLFIDEIANLPLHMQAKLLHTLQENEVRPIGANIYKKVNVRIIAALNQSLQKLVGEDQFREDLYYRLHVYPIYVPSLRDRGKDIALLANHFLEKFSEKHKTKARSFHPGIMRFMRQRAWPGNIRELENFVERLVTLAAPEATVLKPETIPLDLKDEYNRFASEHEISVSNKSLKERLQSCEEQIIRHALLQNDWNQSKAARALKISEQVIRYRMKKLGITRETS